MRAALGVFLALATLDLVGCASDTSILLVVDGDVVPGDDIDQLEVAFTLEGIGIQRPTFELTDEDTLPLSLRIWAGDLISDEVEVHLKASLESQVSLEARRPCEFVPEVQTECRICLYRMCQASAEPECESGACE